ncbi:RHS repeat domain-containing protein [Streptomyces triticirhizae]|uniref:RHS repeat domain-containing protein n=1 Tax=Streptomyces triticirhizae TaxID=2483353 RepID=UPI00389B266F
MVPDLVGAPVLLVDERGAPAWESRSTVWGVPLSSRPYPTTTPLRFPGQYADDETEWHYNYQRHYDPETAAYVTQDPLGLVPADNPGAYVPNPMIGSDPLGLAPHDGTTAGFRRQTSHPGSQRMHVDPNGDVTITGQQQLYVNLSGDIAHTLNFRGGVGEIVSFRVRNDFLEQVRRTAVPQQNPGGFTRAEWREMKRICPEISDPTRGADLYGLPGSMLDDFQNAIIPGSGSVTRS